MSCHTQVDLGEGFRYHSLIVVAGGVSDAVIAQLYVCEVSFIMTRLLVFRWCGGYVATRWNTTQAAGPGLPR